MLNCHSWPLAVSNNVKCHCWPLDVSSNVQLPFLTTRCQWQPIWVVHMKFGIGHFMWHYWGWGGGLSASYIYMHCTRSWNDTDLVYWYVRQLSLRDGGIPSALYIYVLYEIYEWHWLGVLVCKSSMLTRLGGLSASYIYVLYWIYKWHWFGVLYARHLCSIDQGGPSAFGISMFIYALVFSYIFL